MQILTLDIGVTTGWALLWAKGREDDEWGITSCGDAHMDDDLALTLARLQRERPNTVVMEKPLLSFPGPLQHQLRTAVTMAELTFPLHESVTPAQWKSSPAARYPLPRGTSVHARDAVRMGIWWLKSAGVLDTLPT